METNGLILASQSPRRKYLLEQVGLSFKIVPSQVDEQHVTNNSPEILVKILAEAKAKDVADKLTIGLCNHHESRLISN